MPAGKTQCLEFCARPQCLRMELPSFASVLGVGPKCTVHNSFVATCPAARAWCWTVQIRRVAPASVRPSCGGSCGGTCRTGCCTTGRTCPASPCGRTMRTRCCWRQPINLDAIISMSVAAYSLVECLYPVRTQADRQNARYTRPPGPAPSDGGPLHVCRSGGGTPPCCRHGNAAAPAFRWLTPVCGSCGPPGGCSRWGHLDAPPCVSSMLNAVYGAACCQYPTAG